MTSPAAPPPPDPGPDALYCSTSGTYFTDTAALHAHYKSDFHRCEGWGQLAPRCAARGAARGIARGAERDAGAAAPGADGAALMRRPGPAVAARPRRPPPAAQTLAQASTTL